MARFTTLIRLWERRLEAARQRLGTTMTAIAAADADIAACLEERRQAASTDPLWREQYQAFCVWSLEREAAHRHNRAAFEQVAARQREEVAEAYRRNRTFERLQEREDRRLARHERRREQAGLVEYAVRRWREEVHA